MIEILVATMVFALGITMAMRTLPESNSATTKSRNMAIATNLAQQKLEELLGLGYGDPELTAGDHIDPDNPIDSHFERTWNVAADLPVASMKTVQVTVVYPPGEANDNVQLITTITTGR